MDPVSPFEPAPEESVETFQHYRVERRPDGKLWELGRGAMGITYKAQDINLRAPVALKLIRGSLLPDARARERFLREARAAAQLRHTHVATVYHLGEEAGACFYTMEFLDGETAEQLVRRTGPLDTVTALRMAQQVARALQAAHARGMLHRDLKPSNMMVMHEEGEILVKVIDFGLVKSIQVAEGEAGAGASLSQGLFQGTPLYASPEQCAQDESIDGRSDLYSLGATLWHLLSGHPPFQGTARTVVAQHLSKPPPLETLTAQPPAVVELLRDLLAKEPAARPADAATLRARLRDILESLEHSPSPGGMTPPPVRTSAPPPPLPPPSVSNASFSSVSNAGFSSVSNAGFPPPPPRPAMPPPPPTAYQPPPARPAVPVVPPRRGVHPAVVVSGIIAALLIVAVLPVGWAVRHFNKPALAEDAPTPEPAAPVDNDPAKVELAAGKDAVQRGEYEIALTAYQRALRLNPQSPAATAGLQELKETAERLAQEGADLLEKDPIKALEKNRLAAVLGSPRGQNALADQYDTGKGVAKDYAQSYAWYRKAAEADFAPAQFNLGFALANGRGVAKDDVEAAKWYRKAAEQGNTFGQAELGFYLASGRGVPRDDAEAAVWDRKAAEKGNATAQSNLARLILTGRGVPKDPDEAARWFRKAADQNNAVAQDYLGDLYLAGTGVPKDDAQAVFWYRKSAELGNAVAQNDLGYMYQQGRGVPKDDAQAAEWYKKSADQNNSSGQNNLAYFYENGRGGLTKDLTRAAALYRRSAEQGSAVAQSNLAAALDTGRGVTKDPVEAAAWYRKAADQGNAIAQSELGYHYAMALGVQRDDAQALSWYRKSADQNHPSGMNNLAFMLENGRATPVDLPGAVALYRKSAMAGNGAAAGNLGNLYASGRGVPKDESEAIRWWRKGAALGDARCEKALKDRGLTP